jgi:hypothetical protein
MVHNKQSKHLKERRPACAIIHHILQVKGSVKLKHWSR